MIPWENSEERGLETVSLGCGMATWDSKRGAWEPCAPTGVGKVDSDAGLIAVGS
jgi:hypothetical protein